VLHKSLGIALVLILPLALLACTSSGGKTVAGLPPKPPADVKCQVAGEGIEISWNSVHNATHYTVFWGTDRGDYRSMGNSGASSVLLSGLQKEKLYAIAVSAWNESGESNFSEEQLVVYDDETQNSPKYAAKGEELMQRGYYRDAHAYFSAAITCDPENADAYQRRAQLYERMSRTDLAQKDYAQAENIHRKKMSSSAPVKGASLKN
jgi:tetratricopeptide (TPR) repeat protein